MANKIVVCGCEKSGRIDALKIEKLKEQLDSKAISYTYVNDLCGATVHEKQLLKEELTSSTTIYACQPRAVRWLLHSAGINSNPEQITCIDIDKNDQSAEHVDAANDSTAINYTESWSPWFPVIDYDRCTGCRKCVDFCLFGVYSIGTDNSIDVSAPANCKDQCPACARVCPHNAIIFPKSKEAGINGDNAQLEGSSLNVDDFMAQDVYKSLAARRSRSKKSLLKKKQLEVAESERACCSSAPKKDTNKLFSMKLDPSSLTKSTAKKCSGNCETCEDCSCDSESGSGCGCDCGDGGCC